MGDKPLFVYYCKYSGKHALTTDCNLATVPRRGTDHSLVLDTQARVLLEEGCWAAAGLRACRQSAGWWPSARGRAELAATAPQPATCIPRPAVLPSQAHACVLSSCPPLQRFMVKLYTTDGGTKLLRRKCARKGSAAALLKALRAGLSRTPGGRLELNPDQWTSTHRCGHSCRSGAVERQLRLNMGKLPVAYRTEPEGRWVHWGAPVPVC